MLHEMDHRSPIKKRGVTNVALEALGPRLVPSLLQKQGRDPTRKSGQPEPQSREKKGMSPFGKRGPLGKGGRDRAFPCPSSGNTGGACPLRKRGPSLNSLNFSERDIGHFPERGPRTAAQQKGGGKGSFTAICTGTPSESPSEAQTPL